MTTSYKKAVELLTSKEKFHIELGLTRVTRILNYFGNPQDKLKIIHVAGTNGKGSVCSVLSKILEKSGLKTGLFTSPHITKYTERIKINDEPIDEKEFYELIKEIDKACKTTDTYLTEFEIIAVAAFLHYAEKQVDIAVIEVGLGGRLDATNVVKNPILEVITSISLDHTDRLGSTIEEIAYEKAGIIKENSTCLALKNNAGIKVIKEIADKKNANLIIAHPNVKLEYKQNGTFALYNSKKYKFALHGLYQAENLSIVFGAIKALQEKGLKITEDAIVAGLETVRHLGRFDYIKDLNIIADGAHNPDGAKALRLTLNQLYPNKKIVFVYSSISTKDYKTVLKALLTPKDEIYFYNFKRENAVKIEELAQNACVAPKTINNIEELKALALKEKENNAPVVFTGSLYAISELYNELKN